MDQARVDVMDAPGPIHGCQLCLTGPPPWPGLEVFHVHPLPAELVSTWRAQASSCSLCLPALLRSGTEAYPPHHTGSSVKPQLAGRFLSHTSEMITFRRAWPMGRRVLHWIIPWLLSLKKAVCFYLFVCLGLETGFICVALSVLELVL